MKLTKPRIAFIILAGLIIIISAYFLMVTIVEGSPKLDYNYNEESAPPVSYPEANFAVISDPHIYDESLGSLLHLRVRSAIVS